MNIADLYRKMYLIRASENAIKKHYHEDGMKTPMHMSEGGEALVTGVVAAIKKDDQVFGTYRTHALYLAKSEDCYSFFQELYGKDDCLARGKAGSMHLSHPDYGYMLSSAIVASTISVAVGAAFANRYMKNGKMTAVFFGDGAIDEGAFYESINMACLWRLPILFVCEDNEMAVHTKDSIRHGYNNIENIVENFNCLTFTSDSTDVEEIYKLTCNAILEMKDMNCPAFLRLKYYRYLEHVGVNMDFDANYRDKTEFEKWQKKDPLLICRPRVSNADEIEKQVDELVETCVDAAKTSNFSELDTLLKDVFCE